MSGRNGAKARFHLQRKARISKKIRKEMLKALPAKEPLAKPEPVVRPAAN